VHYQRQEETFQGVFRMSTRTFRSSRPDAWVLPKPYSDASLRYRKHGPIQPMDRPTLWERLTGLG